LDEIQSTLRKKKRAIDLNLMGSLVNLGENESNLNGKSREGVRTWVRVEEYRNVDELQVAVVETEEKKKNDG
jgi:hypothetical protein